MPFNLDTWKADMKNRLEDWKPRMQRLGVDSIYAMVSASALLPLVTAYQQEGLLAVGLALGPVVGAVGGNLIANRIQSWKDRSEGDIVGDIAGELAGEIDSQSAEQAELRQALDEILEKLEALPEASRALPPADQAWFVEGLMAELPRLGSRIQIKVKDGAVAIGDHALSLGAGAMFFQNVGGDVIVNSTVKGESGMRQQEKERKQDARRRYLERLRRACQALPLPALGEDEISGAEVTLDKVYIDLDTTTMLEVPEGASPGRGKQQAPEAVFASREEKKRPLSALEAARTCPRLALLGDPGSGKSTFVRNLLACQAGVLLGEAAPLEGIDGDLLPVLIILRDLAPRLSSEELDALSASQQRQRLLQVVRTQIEEDLRGLEAGAFQDDLLQALHDGKCLLALDGLDEVPDGLRPCVRRLTAALLGAYHLPRVLLTCRTRSYGGEAVFPDFQRHELAPFDEEKVRRFAGAWYRAQQDLGRFSLDQAQERAQDLAEAALGSDLRELSANPMMLTSMAVIHQKEIGLPRERVRLYNLVVDVLLRRWQKFKAGESGLTPSAPLAAFLKDDLKLRAAMELLAYEAHRSRAGEEKAADLGRGRALELLDTSAYLGDPGLAAEFLDYVDQRSGLLVGRGGEPGRPQVYSFPHRTFQEYLAGSYLVGQRDLNRAFFAHAGEGDNWNLAAQLGAEELHFIRRSKNALLDLAYSLNCEPVDAQKQRAALWSGNMAVLLGRAEIEGDTASPQGGAAYLDSLRQHLVKVLGGELSPAERAEAGCALGVLGDPRPQVSGLGAMSFCFVPKGRFLMGSTEKDQLADDDEKAQHEVHLPAFWISRFPLSNAQYALFTAEGGYREADFWKEAQSQGVWENGRVKRRTGMVEEGRYQFKEEWAESAYDYGAPHNLPNHPVVGVCWYEALAYCRWLETRARERGWLPAGWSVSLPSEAEWEKAARGGLQAPIQPLILSLEGGLASVPAVPCLEDNPSPGRIYPWGDDFDPGKANAFESGVGRTSAPGCFLGGASPYGVQDLSGNVWEWTRSLSGDYPYPQILEDRLSREALDSAEPRVLRGGAFYDARRFVRCAVRYNGYPDYWYLNVGFRVVVSPAAQGAA